VRHAVVALVSHLDDLGADISGGNQMTLAHQKRLLPGEQWLQFG